MLLNRLAPLGICAIAIFAPRAARADSQPTAGELIYRTHCAACHGQNLEGGQFGPTLTGAAFSTKWFTGDPKGLYNFIARSMPPADAGKLSHEQYAGVTEWIESVARRPAGAANVSSSQSAEGIMNQLQQSHLGVEAAAPEVFHDSRFRTARQRSEAVLSKLTPVDEVMLESPSREDWLAWRGGNTLQSFSQLDQIKAANVAHLEVAWSWSLPVGPNEIEPLVHDGVMFVNSAQEVQALDARSGELLWKYTREIPQQYQGSISGIHRNMALYGPNLYVSTNDRHVVALNVKTGGVVWDREIIPDSQPTVILSAGPIVAHGKVIQSSSGGPGCTGGCAIVGLDAQTGRELWRFNSIAESEKAGQNSWNNLPFNKRSGGGIWIAGSYDPQRNLVFYGVGQTYKLAPLLGPPANTKSSSNALYTDATLALDPDTGRLAWFHQHFPRDVWDLDEVFERTRVTLPGNQEALIEVGKSGILDALEPSNGRYLFSIDLGLQNYAVSIDPKTGARKIRPGLEPKAGVPQFICPSLRGARNWMTTAYDPERHVLYLPLEESCMHITWSPNTNEVPFDIGWSFAPRQNTDGNFGRVQAINLATRKTLWTNRYRAPPASSLLATKGGIVFSGSRDRSFQALDSVTGESLWQVMLNAVPSASPITYSVQGKQYVAIVAGGGGPQDSSSEELTPELHGSTPATTLWVFRLPMEAK